MELTLDVGILKLHSHNEIEESQNKVKLHLYGILSHVKRFVDLNFPVFAYQNSCEIIFYQTLLVSLYSLAG